MIVPYSSVTVIKLPAVLINPRTFEISSWRPFQITDVRLKLHRYCKAGKEIEIYSSSSELIDKIEYYLSHVMREI